MRAEEIVECLCITGALVTLFGALEELLGVSLESWVGRLVADEKADQVSAKAYVLCEHGDVEITGKVDEYEPETLRLVMKVPRAKAASVRSVFEAYRMAYGTGASFRSPEESLKLFRQHIRP